MDIQEALEAARFTKSTFDGVDVSIEALSPNRCASSSSAWATTSLWCRHARGLRLRQAVMSHDGTRVHFGASEPRHDGAAIPEAPPVFG